MHIHIHDDVHIYIHVYVSTHKNMFVTQKDLKNKFRKRNELFIVFHILCVAWLEVVAYI